MVISVLGFLLEGVVLLLFFCYLFSLVLVYCLFWFG